MQITLRVEILILIIVFSIILFSHLLCSCTTMNITEALTTMSDVAKKGTKVVVKEVADNTKKTEKLKEKMTNKHKGKKEGFTGANINNGQSSPYMLNDYTPVNTSSWFTQDLSYSKDRKPKGVQDILNRPQQPVPLPEGQMLMFANTDFKPECCPNTYSNSMGCACMTVPQYNYLIDRGGNNVPYSEY